MNCKLTTLGSKFVKFVMSILKQVNFSPNFVSFFIVTTHNSSVNKLKHFLLWIKRSHQSPNFETFKCSGENLPNFSCHFSNHKSVFPQILHHSSLPWKITPLYFFSSNIIYFGQKEPIKEYIFQTFECLGQNSSNSTCQFWNNKSNPFHIFHHTLVSLHITPLSIFSSCIFYFRQNDPIKVPIATLSSALVKIFQIPYVIFQTTSQFFFSNFTSLFSAM